MPVRHPTVPSASPLSICCCGLSPERYVVMCGFGLTIAIGVVRSGSDLVGGCLVDPLEDVFDAPVEDSRDLEGQT
jgi:hypothetical protein